MEIRTSLRILFRRWPLLALSLLGVVVAMAKFSTSAGPQFQATSTVRLTPPTAHAGAVQAASADPSKLNSLLNSDLDLDVITRVTAAAVSDEAVAARLAGQGATAAYTVMAAEDNGFRLVVTAHDATIASAVRTDRAVVATVISDLASRQKAFGVPERDRIGTLPSGDPQVTRSNKSRVRLLAVVGAVGVSVVVVTLFALEAVSRRHKMAAARRPDEIRTRSALRRRWYLVILGLPLVGMAPLGVVKRASPSYRASSTLVLVPPQIPSDPTVPVDKQPTHNPFLSYSDSLNIMSDLVTTSLMDPQMATTLAAEGATASYNVVNWVQGANPVDTQGNPTPVVFVSATGRWPDIASRTVDAVFRTFNARVRGFQSSTGAPPVTWITVNRVTPTRVYQLHGSKSRALAAFGILALLVLVLLVLVADRVLSLVARFHPHRRDRGGPDRTPPDEPPGSDDGPDHTDLIGAGVGALGVEAPT